MADAKISALTELAVAPDVLDELVIVDKSDTTMAATGTDKRIKAGTIVPVDPAAATAGLRTIGKTALKAADGADTEYAFSRFTPLTDFRGAFMNASVVAGTYLLSPTFATNVLLAAANTSFTAFYLDPADFAAGTRTAKVRLEAGLHANSVSSGTINFVVNLAPIATWGGGSNANATIATLSAAIATLTFTNPGANAHLHSVSSVVDFPTAGWFAVSVVTNQTMATNSDVTIMARLATQQV